MEQLQVRQEDRRVFQRSPLDLSLLYLASGSNQEEDGQAYDISGGGIGIITHKHFASGALVWLNIPYEVGKNIFIKGCVVWSHFVGSDRYRIGIQLVNANLSLLSRLLNRKPQE